MDVNKKMYVPDTKKWTMFYTHINRGSVNPYTDHTMKEYQRGSGLRNKTSSYMISIDNYTKRAVEQDTNPKINMTSPAEQVVEQTKSEVKREKSTTEKGKRVLKRQSQKLNDKKSGRTAKRKKIVKLKSDVFGVY